MNKCTPDFAFALHMLKRGYRMSRKGWNGRDMYIHLKRGTDTVRPYLVMKDAQGMVVNGWLASQTDMLAEDWKVYGE